MADETDAAAFAWLTRDADQLLDYYTRVHAAATTNGDRPDLADWLPPDLDQFLAEGDTDHQWVVEGLAEAGDRIILTGVEGQGKTTLLRQIAVQLASGIHPFTHRHITALRVLYVDCENSDRQVRRKLADLRPHTTTYVPGNLRIHVVTDALEIAREPVYNALALRVQAHQPHIIIIGPLYKMLHDDPVKELPAKDAANALDRLRHLCGSVLIIEAHSPYQETARTKRLVRPYGASLWSRWPEFGLYLAPDGKLEHWRGPRDEREWPAKLQRGNPWPWMPDQATETPYAGPTHCMDAIEHWLTGRDPMSKKAVQDGMRLDGLRYRHQTINDSLELLARAERATKTKGPRGADLFQLPRSDTQKDLLDF